MNKKNVSRNGNGGGGKIASASALLPPASPAQNHCCIHLYPMCLPFGGSILPLHRISVDLHCKTPAAQPLRGCVGNSMDALHGAPRIKRQRRQQRGAIGRQET